MSNSTRLFENLLSYFFICAVLFSCEQKKEPGLSLTQYVDPFIGTGFHGHVFLGANVPFGAVQPGPVNIADGRDWCSGYHYSDYTWRYRFYARVIS